MNFPIPSKPLGPLNLKGFFCFPEVLQMVDSGDSKSPLYGFEYPFPDISGCGETGSDTAVLETAG